MEGPANKGYGSETEARRARRPVQLYAALACLFGFLAIAGWSWRYARLPDPFQLPSERTFWQWLSSPIERNAFLRLPLVTGNLESVVAVPDGTHVFAVGDGALILHSADGGETWERQQRIDWSRYGGGDVQEKATTPPESNAPPMRQKAALQRPPAREDKRSWSFDLIPAAVAAVAPNAAQIPSGLDGISPEQRQDPTAQMALPQAEEPVESPQAVRGADVDRANDLRAVAFSDASQGIAVGEGGLVLRTDDGGANWIAQPAFTNVALNAVAYADSDHVLIGGAGGGLWLSTDGGETFADVSPGSNADLYAVSFLSAERAVAAGAGGTVWWSSDGGTRWIEANSAISETITQIALTPKGDLVAVAALPGLWVSNDLGATWSNLAQENDTIIEHLAFASDGEGVALGSFGGVLRSSDGGRTWLQPVQFGEPSFYASIAAAGDGRFVVVGSGGAVLLSRDSGATWHPMVRGVMHVPETVRFSSPLHGEAELPMGNLLVSEDGGRNWTYALAAAERPMAPRVLPRIEVTDAGAIRISRDDGKSWRVPVYARYPSPLLLLLSGSTLVLGTLGARKAWHGAPVEVVTSSITDLFAPDRPLRPGERDALKLGEIAAGISRFLRNRSTEPPLTIAVTGEWGSGKSSLMGLLLHDLRERGFRPVWFNAWHHQRGENLLASLYANIRAQGIPSLLTPEGIGFRWQLFLIRARCYWLRLATTLTLSSLVLFYLWHHQASGGLLLDLIQLDALEALAKFGEITAGGKALVGGGLLAALAPPVWGAFKALSSFGLDPKKLLGTIASTGAATGGLSAQPGVRYQFRQEFLDVTAALRPHTLTIFIDDLDRCTQEHVLEVLETINFLVSAGECFIVLGMSRRWVETCVGLAFSELAAETPDDEQPRDPAAPKPAVDDDPRDERRRFARQYLEKLINIEVPIPAVTSATAAAMLARSTQPPLPWRAQLALWLGDALRAYALPIFVLAILAGTWTIARRLPDFRIDPGNGTVLATTTDAMPGVRPGTDSAALEPSRDATAEPHFIAGAHDAGAVLLDGVAVLLGTLGIGTLLVVLIVRRNRIETIDSEKFTLALEVMRPWILLGHQTPRLLKRYVNHVRFVAMRQRFEPELDSMLDRILRQARMWLGLHAGAEQARSMSETALGDPLLVALSAVQQAKPDWQTDPDWLRDAYTELAAGRYANVLEFPATAGNGVSPASVTEHLVDAIKTFNEKFPEHRVFTDSASDRKAIKTLIELLAGVRVD